MWVNANPVVPVLNANLPLVCLACVALSVAAAAARSQDVFPLRPVRIVVPYPPGGSTDPIARLIGTGPTLTDLMGGHVQLLFTLPIAVIQHIQRGALRGIAISGNARLPALSRIPTFTEAGLPRFEVSTWQGILAPARVTRRSSRRQISALNDMP